MSVVYNLYLIRYFTFQKLAAILFSHIHRRVYSFIMLFISYLFDSVLYFHESVNRTSSLTLKLRFSLKLVLLLLLFYYYVFEKRDEFQNFPCELSAPLLMIILECNLKTHLSTFIIKLS